MATFTSLVARLQEHAATRPNDLAYRFLVDGEDVEQTITYGELDRRARTIAGMLQEAAPEGSRVLLLFPSGIEYLTGFFGTLYAGAVAVPAYPPDLTRLQRSLPRMVSIAADARAAVALTSAEFLAMATGLSAAAPEMASMRWLATDRPTEGAEARWKPPAPTADATAWLQYTSGSTAAPRGVMVTHGNVVANIDMLVRTAPLAAGDGFVTWLPPYHDMGLVGGLLFPMWNANPVTLMSPIEFLRKPSRWMRALSRHRATQTVGPSFAYDLAARKTTPAELATLSLGHVEATWNGAEPIRADAIERFTDTFVAAGFKRTAWIPCYGLAEATLMASATRRDPLIVHVDAGTLERGRVVSLSPEFPGARRLVASGRPAHDSTIKIVDGKTNKPCRADEVGEIWLQGPHIAAGYFGRPEDETFTARLADGAGPFLRTGDIGFMAQGELFVSGRIKDLVIIHGRNHHPQELEATAEAVAGVRPGCVAAFAVDVDGAERLVLVAEVEDALAKGGPEKLAALGQAVAVATLDAHEIAPVAFVALPPREIPKTSSGKIQRRECRAAYLAEKLPTVHVWREARATQGKGPTGGADPLAAYRGLAPEERVRQLRQLVVERIAAIAQLPVEHLDVTAPMGTLGIDSVSALELQVSFEEMGVVLPVTTYLRSTIADVAELLAAKVAAA